MLIDLLQPHFVQLEEGARVRRLAGAFAAGAEDSGNVVVLGPL